MARLGSIPSLSLLSLSLPPHQPLLTRLPRHLSCVGGRSPQIPCFPRVQYTPTWLATDSIPAPVHPDVDYPLKYKAELVHRVFIE